MLKPIVKDIEQIAKQPDKLLAIEENATVAEAARKMTDNRVGCLVVFDAQDRFAGVLTERDMLAKILPDSLPPDKVLAKHIMTKEAISCTMDTPIAAVEQLMAEHKIRHVPIIENGIPVGMVSSRDVIAYRLRINNAMKNAAEELATLPAGLKSLDFDDVTALAINEVPKSFNADRAVLCLAQKGSSPPMIYRKACPLSQEKLLRPEKMRKLSENGQIISGENCNEACRECKTPAGQASRLIIPLSIQEQFNDRDGSTISRQGFLCMCQLNSSSVGPEELRLYKASLLQEVLNANLTNAKLYQNYQKARRDSEIDPLTGVGTRRVLDHVLKVEYSRALRYKHSFSIAIVDVDNFKEINDNAGHAAGDRMLRQLAKIMRRNVRMTDIIITRYGGDEFVLLMPETKLNEAMVLLERLRRQVKTISIPKVPSVTISCGVAEWSASPEESAENILQRADTALYEAKRAGRNCVMTSQPTTSNQ
jgi:diguanylate cyclase (GGDEF)-like protein